MPAEAISGRALDDETVLGANHVDPASAADWPALIDQDRAAVGQGGLHRFAPNPDHQATVSADSMSVKPVRGEQGFSAMNEVVDVGPVAAGGLDAQMLHRPNLTKGSLGWSEPGTPSNQRASIPVSSTNLEIISCGKNDRVSYFA